MNETQLCLLLYLIKSAEYQSRALGLDCSKWVTLYDIINNMEIKE